MKKKINRQLIFISVLAVGITLLMMAAVFYRIFQIQVIEDLRLFTHALAQSGETELVMLSADRMEENAQEEVSGTVEPEKEMSGANVSETDKADRIGDSVRITLISAAGQVLYDSNASTGGMDNHAERPEVRDALKNGEGYSIRQSSTMRKNTFYYTMCLEDGNVLRVAREAHSLWSILYRSVPALMAAVCALLALCMFLSHYLTKSLLMPIERMAADMDCMEEQDVYEELRPFSRTIRRQHEAILKNADVRQEFSANVSHELKTPLTAISGYSELIGNGMASGPDVLRFAAEIHKSANRLLMLIDDTIRLSELDTSDKQIPFEKIDLYVIVKNCAEMLQFKAEERNVRLTVDGGACVIEGDRQMLEELVYNLCDNAVCYNNPGGSVMITVRREEGKKMLRVKDTGIGIPEEHQERIFERFYRVDKSRSKSTGGTGLGLAIVKHIVAVHHAQMTLYSEPGKGTEIGIVFE